MKRTTVDRVAFVGAGRLARALIPALRQAGIRTVAVAAPRLAAARRAARQSPGARAMQDPRETARATRVLFLAVPDRVLATVADELAREASLDWTGRVVLHHAGALGPEVLGPLEAAGAAVGVLHPLQTLTGERSASWLKGSAVRIEGSAAARSVARRLARRIGLVPLRCPPILSVDQRLAYHAAASLAANDTVTLLGTAIELFEALGLGRRAAARALLPLVRGTLEQFGSRPTTEPLSGPAARGDSDTILAHVDRLLRVAPEVAEAHRQLALTVLRQALERGAPLPPGARDRLQRRGPSRRPKL